MFAQGSPFGQTSLACNISIIQHVAYSTYITIINIKTPDNRAEGT